MTTRRRELLIAVVLTALFLAARGYVFGLRDHAIHLPYAVRAADPGFLAGDPMLDVAARHPTFFFGAVARLSAVASLETIYFIGYALSVFAMILGLRSLARHLWGGPAGAWAAAVAVVGAFVHRYVGGAIENLDASFLPRVASLGPLLWALSLGVRGRFLAAFLVAGGVFSFHATTAAHTALLLWMMAAFGGRARSRACLLGPVVFLAAASPLLVKMGLGGSPGIPTPAPEAWIQSLKLQYPFHHFPRPGLTGRKVVPAMVAVCLAIAVSRRGGAGRLLGGFLVGAVLLLVAGFVGNRLLASPATIHLHLLEVGRMLDYVAVAALGRWTWSAAHGRPIVGLAAAGVAAAYLIRMPIYDWMRYRVVLDLWLLAAALGITILVQPERLAGRWFGAARLRAIVNRFTGGTPSLRRGYVAAAILGIALIAASGYVPQWKPSGSFHPGHRMMDWARGNLPADAVVILPPYMDEAVGAFRYFARRRAIGSWRDGGEGTFDLDFQLAWERQIRDLTGVGDRIRVPRGAVRWPVYQKWVAGAQRSYHRQTAAHFVTAAKRHGATHLVREASSPTLLLPVAYRDEEYVLYRCASQDEGAR